MATTAAHCAHASEIPPICYQPVLHGAAPQITALNPSGGRLRYTRAPVPALS